MVNETILAVIIAFAVSAALCPIVIPFLHKLKFGQQVREDGPQSPFKKTGDADHGRTDHPFTAIVITSLILYEEIIRGSSRCCS